jgi:hypothetical protein
VLTIIKEMRQEAGTADTALSSILSRRSSVKRAIKLTSKLSLIETLAQNNEIKWRSTSTERLMKQRR